MNNGVALLLERMKTHPEEFTTGKWNALIQSHKMFLNEEDSKALDAGVNDIMQQQFTEKVLEGLVDPKSSKDSEQWADSVMQAKGMHLGGATLGQSWVNQQLAAAQVQSQVEHLKAHQAHLEKEKMHAQIAMAKAEYDKQQSKTLYGRLKNYLHND